MVRKQDGFVIVPAYNEASVIEQTLRSLIERGYRVVVVDDCSKDDTWKIINALPVTGIHHPINLGAGAATETGMEYARRRNANFVVHFDADGQHDPNDIEGMLTVLDKTGADVVFGSRFLRPSDIAAIPLVRRILLRGAIIVSGLASGIWLSDTHIGFRVLSRAALHKIRLTENGFSHGTEILSLIRRFKFKISEFPTHVLYTEYSRRKGQSSWNAINILLDLLIRRVF